MFFGVWAIMALMFRARMSLLAAIGTSLILPIMGTLVAANAISAVAMAANWLPEVVARNRAKSAEFDSLILDLEGLFDAPPKWLSEGVTDVTPPDGSDPNHGGSAPGYDPNTSALPADQNPHTPALEPEYNLIQVPDFQQCVWDAYKAAQWSKKIPLNSAPPWGTELTDWSPEEIMVIKNKSGDFYLFSAPWPGPVKIERVVFTRWSALGIEIGPESAKAAMEASLGRSIQDDTKKAFSVLGSGVYPPECYEKQPVVQSAVPTAETAPAAPLQEQQTPVVPERSSTPGIPVVEPVFN